jgi:hypothetical protein
MEGDEEWRCAVCGVPPDDKRVPPHPSREPERVFSQGSHEAVMAELDGMLTDEQRRRVAVMKKAVKGLPMRVRVQVAMTWLWAGAKLPNRQWNAMVKKFVDERKAREATQ